jgi:hypothetical protein
VVYDLQDCVATIFPYPHYTGDRGDDYDVASAISDPDSMWVVRPQLLFQCTLRPNNATEGHYSRYSDEIDVAPPIPGGEDGHTLFLWRGRRGFHPCQLRHTTFCSFQSVQQGSDRTTGGLDLALRGITVFATVYASSLALTMTTWQRGPGRRVIVTVTDHDAMIMM